MSKLTITAESQDDYGRAEQTIKTLFELEKDRDSICVSKINGELLEIQINSSTERIILPHPQEYSAELISNRYELTMNASNHVGEPIYPPKTIVIKLTDGADIHFAKFVKCTFK
jgi:hypothetical protein